MRPNPILHFAPFLSTDFFPCLNPIFKNGSFLSVVRSSPEKGSILAPTPSSSPRGLPQSTFPNVKNDAGQKQKSPCFLRRRRRPKASDAFTRTRLMPTFGAEGPKLGGLVFRVFRVFRAYGLGVKGEGGVLGGYFGFGRTKTTQM